MVSDTVGSVTKTLIFNCDFSIEYIEAILAAEEFEANYEEWLKN
jgi:hypothetical protein